jgi:hypothetical protein
VICKGIKGLKPVAFELWACQQSSTCTAPLRRNVRKQETQKPEWKSPEPPPTLMPASSSDFTSAQGRKNAACRAVAIHKLRIPKAANFEN